MTDNVARTMSDIFDNAFTTQAYLFTDFEGGFYSIHLPVILKNYGQGPSPGSLYSHVTDSGLPATGTPLQRSIWQT